MKKEFKGTKGKWKVSKEINDGIRVCIQDESNYNSIDCWFLNHGCTDIELNANAKLIAAAPDLLEALQELLPLAEQTVIHRKAKGTHNLGGVFLDSAIRKANKAIQKAL